MDRMKLQKQLTEEEGSKLYPYPDTDGNLTIGIGHNLTAKGISTTVQNLLWVEDVQDAIDLLNHLFPRWIELDDVRQRVFCDLAFNMGDKLAQFVKMLAAAAEHNWVIAASELKASAWYGEVGRRGPRLYMMLLTGTDVPLED